MSMCTESYFLRVKVLNFHLYLMHILMKVRVQVYLIISYYVCTSNKWYILAIRTIICNISWHTHFPVWHMFNPQMLVVQTLYNIALDFHSPKESVLTILDGKTIQLVFSHTCNSYTELIQSIVQKMNEPWMYHPSVFMITFIMSQLEIRKTSTWTNIIPTTLLSKACPSCLLQHLCIS